jgi:hypothetical protein
MLSSAREAWFVLEATLKREEGGRSISAGTLSLKKERHRWMYDEVYVPYCIPATCWNFEKGGDEEDTKDACYFQAREHVLHGNF